MRKLVTLGVDFGASDKPMTEEEMEDAPLRVLHIPTVLDAVTVAYNVKGVGKGLKLTGENLVQIFLGEIKKWNDRRIAKNNAELFLPNQDIVVVHRTDGSGTTYILTEYLSKVGLAWKNSLGNGNTVQWPVGVGCKGNTGMVETLTRTPGGIGYVELAAAKAAKLACAAIQNRTGNFIMPSTGTTTAAMEHARIPSDYRMSIVNAPGPNAYPIASMTWILVYRTQKNEVKGRALAKFLWWALHGGQGMAEECGYAPLPTNVVAMVEKTLLQIKCNDKPLLIRGKR